MDQVTQTIEESTSSRDNYEIFHEVIVDDSSSDSAIGEITIDKLNSIVLNEKSKPIQRILALQILKECMAKKKSHVVNSFVKNKKNNLWEKIKTWAKTSDKKAISSILGKQANPQEAAEFHALILACVFEWSANFGLDKNKSPTIFKKFYDECLKSSIKFSNDGQKSIISPNPSLSQSNQRVSSGSFGNQSSKPQPTPGGDDNSSFNPQSIYNEYQNAINEMKKIKTQFLNLCQSSDVTLGSFDSIREEMVGLNNSFSNSSKINALLTHPDCEVIMGQVLEEQEFCREFMEFYTMVLSGSKPLNSLRAFYLGRLSKYEESPRHKEEEKLNMEASFGRNVATSNIKEVHQDEIPINHNINVNAQALLKIEESKEESSEKNLKSPQNKPQPQFVSSVANIAYSSVLPAGKPEEKNNLKSQVGDMKSRLFQTEKKIDSSSRVSKSPSKIDKKEIKNSSSFLQSNEKQDEHSPKETESSLKKNLSTSDLHKKQQQDKQNENSNSLIKSAKPSKLMNQSNSSVSSSNMEDLKKSLFNVAGSKINPVGIKFGSNLNKTSVVGMQPKIEYKVQSVHQVQEDNSEELLRIKKENSEMLKKNQDLIYQLEELERANHNLKDKIKHLENLPKNISAVPRMENDRYSIETRLSLLINEHENLKRKLEKKRHSKKQLKNEKDGLLKQRESQRHRLQELTIENEKISIELNKLQQSHEFLQQKHHSDTDLYNRKVDEVGGNCKKYQLQNEDLILQLEDLTKKFHLQENKLQHALNENDHLKKVNSNLSSDCTSYKENLIKLQNSYAIATEDHKASKEAYETGFAKMKNEINKLAGNLKSLNEENEELRKDGAEYKKQIDAFKRKEIQLNSSNDESTSNITKLRTQIQSLQHELNLVENERNQLEKSRIQLAGQLKSVNEDFTSLKIKHEEVAREAERLRIKANVRNEYSVNLHEIEKEIEERKQEIKQQKRRNNELKEDNNLIGSPYFINEKKLANDNVYDKNENFNEKNKKTDKFLFNQTYNDYDQSNNAQISSRHYNEINNKNKNKYGESPRKVKLSSYFKNQHPTNDKINILDNYNNQNHMGNTKKISAQEFLSTRVHEKPKLFFNENELIQPLRNSTDSMFEANDYYSMPMGNKIISPIPNKYFSHQVIEYNPKIFSQLHFVSENNSLHFKICCLKDRGILLDDKDLIISVSSTIVKESNMDKANAKLMLMYQNKTNQNLNGITIHFHGDKSMTLKMKNEQPPQVLGPRAEFVQNAMITYEQIPYVNLNIEILYNERRLFISLPLLITKFLVAKNNYNSSFELFQEKWIHSKKSGTVLASTLFMVNANLVKSAHELKSYIPDLIELNSQKNYDYLNGKCDLKYGLLAEIGNGPENEFSIKINFSTNQKMIVRLSFTHNNSVLAELALQTLQYLFAA